MNVNPDENYFVDTNILVYAFDLSAGDKHSLAVKLVEQWWENGNGCLSIRVLQEFFVTVTRKIALPLEHHTARQLVSDLSHWRLQLPDAEDLLHAIDLQQMARLSFWDAMIVQSAARLGCRWLFSEDLNHGQKVGEVQIINPFILPGP
jgi:predicted nucleic acid-binding protein